MQCTSGWCARGAVALLGVMLVGIPTVRSQDLVRSDNRSQSPAPNAAGIIRGTVTTQNGTIPLAGVGIALRSADGEIARVLSEGDGAFRIEALTTGKYVLV